MIEKITGFLEKHLQPFAVKLSNITIIQAISQGMLGIICITVGACAVSILCNLPIAQWQELLTNIGILKPAKELVTATTSMLGIYSVVSVSYCYSKLLNRSTRTNVLLAVATFTSLMPQTLAAGETTVAGLSITNFGSNGIFPAILIGILIPLFYDFLLKKNVKLNLPEQVPPMVSEAMNPIFAAMVIFVVVLLIKWGVSLTPYGDIFNMLYQLLTAPTMATFGTSVLTPLVWCMLRALFWFFGIHPSPLNAMYYPLSSIATAANVDAFMAGEPLPYLAFGIMVLFGMIGGTGSTLGLNIVMLKAKSERYKALSKVAIIPSCFNINEPLVFGVPMMYNPMMLIPSLLAPVVGGIVCTVFTSLNLIPLNPTVSVAWVVPYPIAGFLRGGIMLAIAICITIVLQGMLYYPFFKILDKQALAEENNN